MKNYSNKQNTFAIQVTDSKEDWKKVCLIKNLSVIWWFI